MLLWILITVSLTLAGLTGMQFFYMMILERRDREQKKRIQELEKRCVFLASRVDEAEEELMRQGDLLETISEEQGETDGDEDEVWAEIIDEG